MPKHLRTVLKNISKDDVANCRRSKKQIEKSEDIKIRDLLSGDYWKFVYRGFKFKVQHPVLGYWRLLKKLHRVS